MKSLLSFKSFPVIVRCYSQLACHHMWRAAVLITTMRPACTEFRYERSSCLKTRDPTVVKFQKKNKIIFSPQVINQLDRILGEEDSES